MHEKNSDLTHTSSHFHTRWHHTHRFVLNVTGIQKHLYRYSHLRSHRQTPGHTWCCLSPAARNPPGYFPPGHPDATWHDIHIQTFHQHHNGNTPQHDHQNHTDTICWNRSVSLRCHNCKTLLSCHCYHIFFLVFRCVTRLRSDIDKQSHSRWHHRNLYRSAFCLPFWFRTDSTWCMQLRFHCCHILHILCNP